MTTLLGSAISLTPLPIETEQDITNTDEVLEANEIKQSKMTRASAFELQTWLFSASRSEDVSTQSHLFRALSYTQHCLNHAKWFLWSNTDNIIKETMWEQIKVNCNCGGDGEVRPLSTACAKCLFNSELDIVGDYGFGLNSNFEVVDGDGQVVNLTYYQVESFTKLNQLFMKIKCWGRIVRGTRMDKYSEDGGALTDVNWPVIMTSGVGEHSSDSEQMASAKAGGKSVDVNKIWGTERQNMYMQKKRVVLAKITC